MALRGVGVLIMAHEGTQHFESSSALKPSGPYATRWLVWPPEGFREPTREELITILGYRKRINLKRFTVDDLVRFLEVLDWFHDLDRRDPLHEVSRTAWRDLTSEVVDFLHVVRRELYQRPDRRPYFTIRHQRCSMCSHASDRLWEATADTHGLVDRNDEPIKSVFLCASCWSTYVKEV